MFKQPFTIRSIWHCLGKIILTAQRNMLFNILFTLLTREKIVVTEKKF